GMQVVRPRWPPGARGACLAWALMQTTNIPFPLVLGMSSMEELSMRAMAWSWILIPALLVTAAKADDPGQKFFDQALEKRLQAESLRELTEVIDLAEKALDAGMSGPNKQFCESFL